MNNVDLKISQHTYNYIWVIVLFVLAIKSYVVLVAIYEPFHIDLGYLIFTIPPLLLLLSISFLFSKRIQVFYYLWLDLFLSLVFIIDIIYGRAFGQLISVLTIIENNTLDDLGGCILSIINPTDFMLLIDLPIFFIIAKRIPKEEISQRRFKFFVFSILVSMSLWWFHSKQVEDKISGDLGSYPLFMSPIGSHLYDITCAIHEKNEELDYQDINKIQSWLKLNEQYQDADDKYSQLEGILKEKNIIAIQFESLENFLIGKTFFGQEITPNINKLLNNSIYFNNIHEQVNLGNSSDAELLFNTSVYPINNGSTFMQFSDNTFISLPNLIKSRGYNSIAIHGDNKEYWNRDKFFPALGFDEYISEEVFNNRSECGMGILDEHLFSQAILEIKKLDGPFYVYLITITSHMPFNIDEDLKLLNLSSNDVSSNYLQSIAYTDKMFGEFYEQLSINGILDDSTIVIYGDHEGIHKYYETDLPSNNFEIPYIIHIPSFAGIVINKTGGQVDMMPTLAYLLGIEKERYASNVMGRNLFSSYPGVAILQNGVVLGDPDDHLHLTNSFSTADLIIKGNYFSIK